MKQSEPTPKGFVENAFYEQVKRIMRGEPRRFFLFSPQTKYALSVYLDLKDRHEMRRAA
jgi:hypothetical protein